MTLQEKLKANTAALHNQLEQLMFVDSIMQKKLTLPQYKKLLTCNYLVHLHYEDELFKNISKNATDLLNIHVRKKLNALKNDLQEVGLNTDSLTNVFIKPLDIKDESSAIGAMYVLEGATLGGSVIVKQLGLNPNFTEKFNFNYYNIYGKELILNWQQFLAYLNSLPQTNYTEVLAGALNMFEAIIAIAKQLQNTEVD